ncbi:MAG: D-aminoacylase [Candidatus Aminicenantes bacterium]|nr:D-aminoacylase [Candidatus Aminicenantes bacterium]
MNRRTFLKTSAKAGLAIGMTGGILRSYSEAGPQSFDILIKNGRMIDGIKDEAFSSDLGIISDRIAAIGQLSATQAKIVIDARNKIVCPGFIDIHSHTDFELFVNPKAESKIRQGITTELSGNCGGSMFPLKKDLTEYEKAIKDAMGIECSWTDLKGYHELMAKQGTAVNHATLVGHGTIRMHVLGSDRRRPNSNEMKAMKKLAAEAMEQGAFGISTGLEYAPDRFTATEDLIEVCKTVALYDGFYATHMRSEDTQLMEAVAEALHIAEQAGLPLQISHLKVAGRRNYYKMNKVFDLIENAEADGLDVTADRYPYTAYATTLNIMFPMWALDGGSDEFVRRLKNKDLRQKMREEALEKVEGNNSWENMLITSVNKPDNKPLVGKYIREAAEQAGQDPYEFACDLLISEGGELSIIGFGMDDQNTSLVLKHPLVMLCSDGVALAPYGKLSEGIPHPRNYGAFPRFLGKYVREEKLLPLAEAIKKMTSMPAQRLGLKERGTLKKGNYADIVVFDAATVKDRATFTQPELYPQGIDYVLVNGTVVIKSGEHTGELPGKILNSRG